MPIVKEASAEVAHRVIREQILDGTHVGGAMLSENSLAEALGMSRTPVRAALLRLELEGWVTIYPKRGALVRVFTDRDSREVAQARLLLEVAGVRAASPAVLQSLCSRLDGLVDEQAGAAASDDLDRFVESSSAFHAELVAVGGNSLLIEFGERLSGRQARMLHQSMAVIDDHADTIVADHRAMVEACRSRDLDAFEALLHAHLHSGADSSPVHL